MLCLGASHQTCTSVIQPSGNGKHLGNNDSSRESGHNIHSGLDCMTFTFKVTLIWYIYTANLQEKLMRLAPRWGRPSAHCTCWPLIWGPFSKQITDYMIHTYMYVLFILLCASRQRKYWHERQLHLLHQQPGTRILLLAGANGSPHNIHADWPRTFKWTRFYD